MRHHRTGHPVLPHAPPPPAASPARRDRPARRSSRRARRAHRRPQDAAPGAVVTRDHARPGADQQRLQHLDGAGAPPRSPASLGLSGTAGAVAARHRGRDARGVGRWPRVHGAHPAGHLLRRPPGLRRPPARAGGAGLRLLDQALLRPALELQRPVPVRVAEAAGPGRRARAGAEDAPTLRLRPRSGGPARAGPLHAAHHAGRARPALHLPDR